MSELGDYKRMEVKPMERQLAALRAERDVISEALDREQVMRRQREAERDMATGLLRRWLAGGDIAEFIDETRRFLAGLAAAETMNDKDAKDEAVIVMWNDP